VDGGGGNAGCPDPTGAEEIITMRQAVDAGGRTGEDEGKALASQTSIAQSQTSLQTESETISLEHFLGEDEEEGKEAVGKAVGGGVGQGEGREGAVRGDDSGGSERVSTSTASVTTAAVGEVKQKHLPTSRRRMYTVEMGGIRLRKGTGVFSRMRTITYYQVVLHPARSIAGTEPIIIFRRYSDFAWIRHLLCRKYPGIAVPPIPKKSFQGLKAKPRDEFRQIRKEGLGTFLQGLIDEPVFGKDPIVLSFLHPPLPSDDKQRKGFCDWKMAVRTGLLTKREKIAIQAASEEEDEGSYSPDNRARRRKERVKHQSFHVIRGGRKRRTGRFNSSAPAIFLESDEHNELQEGEGFENLGGGVDGVEGKGNAEDGAVAGRKKERDGDGEDWGLDGRKGTVVFGEDEDEDGEQNDDQGYHSGPESAPSFQLSNREISPPKYSGEQRRSSGLVLLPSRRTSRSFDRKHFAANSRISIVEEGAKPENKEDQPGDEQPPSQLQRGSFGKAWGVHNVGNPLTLPNHLRRTSAERSNSAPPSFSEPMKEIDVITSSVGAPIIAGAESADEPTKQAADDHGQQHSSVLHDSPLPPSSPPSHAPKRATARRVVFESKEGMLLGRKKIETRLYECVKAHNKHRKHMDKAAAKRVSEESRRLSDLMKTVTRRKKELAKMVEERKAQDVTRAEELEIQWCLATHERLQKEIAEIQLDRYFPKHTNWLFRTPADDGLNLGCKDITLEEISGRFRVDLRSLPTPGQGRSKDEGSSSSSSPSGSTFKGKTCELELTQLRVLLQAYKFRIRGSSGLAKLLGALTSPNEVVLKLTGSVRVPIELWEVDRRMSFKVDPKSISLKLKLEKEIKGAASIPDRLANYILRTLIPKLIIKGVDAIPYADVFGPFLLRKANGGTCGGSFTILGDLPKDVWQADLNDKSKASEEARRLLKLTALQAETIGYLARRGFGRVAPSFKASMEGLFRWRLGFAMEILENSVEANQLLHVWARAAAHAEGEVLFKHHGNRLEEGKARGYDPNWFLEVVKLVDTFGRKPVTVHIALDTLFLYCNVMEGVRLGVSLAIAATEELQRANELREAKRKKQGKLRGDEALKDFLETKRSMLSESTADTKRALRKIEHLVMGVLSLLAPRLNACSMIASAHFSGGIAGAIAIQIESLLFDCILPSFSALTPPFILERKDIPALRIEGHKDEERGEMTFFISPGWDWEKYCNTHGLEVLRGSLADAIAHGTSLNDKDSGYHLTVENDSITRGARACSLGDQSRRGLLDPNLHGGGYASASVRGSHLTIDLEKKKIQSNSGVSLRFRGSSLNGDGSNGAGGGSNNNPIPHEANGSVTASMRDDPVMHRRAVALLLSALKIEILPQVQLGAILGSMHISLNKLRLSCLTRSMLLVILTLALSPTAGGDSLVEDEYENSAQYCESRREGREEAERGRQDEEEDEDAAHSSAINTPRSLSRGGRTPRRHSQQHQHQHQRQQSTDRLLREPSSQLSRTSSWRSRSPPLSSPKSPPPTPPLPRSNGPMTMPPRPPGLSSPTTAGTGASVAGTPRGGAYAPTNASSRSHSSAHEHLHVQAPNPIASSSSDPLHQHQQQRPQPPPHPQARPLPRAPPSGRRPRAGDAKGRSADEEEEELTARVAARRGLVELAGILVKYVARDQHGLKVRVRPLSVRIEKRKGAGSMGSGSVDGKNQERIDNVGRTKTSGPGGSVGGGGGGGGGARSPPPPTSRPPPPIPSGQPRALARMLPQPPLTRPIAAETESSKALASSVSILIEGARDPLKQQGQQQKTKKPVVEIDLRVDLKGLVADIFSLVDMAAEASDSTKKPNEGHNNITREGSGQGARTASSTRRTNSRNNSNSNSVNRGNTLITAPGTRSHTPTRTSRLYGDSKTKPKSSVDL